MSSRDLGTVRALICEDEPIAVRALRAYLTEVDWVEVVDDARDGGTAMRLIHKLEPDLVFMDVRMPGLSGVEVLEAVTDRPAVVFTTAFDEYAVKAFELGAVDYLVKPFGRERLIECLDRVRIRLVGEGRAGGRRDAPAAGDGGARRPELLFARRGEVIVPVPAAEVVRVDAERGGACLVTREGRFHLPSTLAELETRLDPSDFVRVHRGHLVNLRHVDGIQRYDERRLRLTLTDGSHLVASRGGSDVLRARMA